MALNARVNEPRRARNRFTDGVNSKRSAKRKIKKTPAITRVEECIKAEAGVGASIASGNQT